MSDTLWCDLSAINARLSKLEARLDRIEKYTPAEVAAILEGLKCSLAVVERQVKELKAVGYKPSPTEATGDKPATVEGRGE